MGKYNCSPKEFAQLIFDEIIYLEKRHPSIIKFIEDGEYTPAEKAKIESLQKGNVQIESFYFWAFLVTYCIHKELSDMGNKRTKPIHDILRTLIYQHIAEGEAPLHARNTFKQRLTQYSDALKTDIECLGLKDTILFFNLTTSFFENLLEKKLSFSEFGEPRILFGLYVAELMIVLKDTTQKLKAGITIVAER